MFYVLLCFYLWIYGTLNKISNIYIASSIMELTKYMIMFCDVNLKRKL